MPAYHFQPVSLVFSLFFFFFTPNDILDATAPRTRWYQQAKHSNACVYKVQLSTESNLFLGNYNN